MKGLRRFMLARYGAYSFLALEVLLLPLLVPPRVYGDIEYFRYVAGLAPTLFLGSHTGYMYVLYTQGRDNYPALLHGGLLVLAVGTAILATAMNVGYLAPAVLVAGIAVVLEKRMQSGKQFYLAILYRPLVAVVLLAAAGVWTARGFQLYGAALVNVGYCGALLIWCLAMVRFCTLSLKEVFLPVGSRRFLSDYGRLIQAGFVENLATVFLGLFLFADRQLLRSAGSAALPVFSLAFNLAQFAVIGVNSIGYVSAVAYGEGFSTLEAAHVRRGLSRAFAVCAFLGFATVLVALVYDRMVMHNDGLVMATALVLLGSGIYFSVGTASAIILYGNLQWRSTAATGIAAALNWGLSSWMIASGFPWVLLVAKTAVLLIALAAFNFALIFSVLRSNRVA
jgi:hypothetical protein